MHQIIDLLRYDGWFVERNNVGAAHIPGTDRFVRFGTKGKADITALKNGTFVALEVKTPRTRKNTTRWQEEYLEQIRLHGGVAQVVCSVQEAAEALNIKMLF